MTHNRKKEGTEGKIKNTTKLKQQDRNARAKKQWRHRATRKQDKMAIGKLIY